MDSIDANAIIFPPINSSMKSATNYFPIYRSEFFLRQKYVEEGLSITKIADLIFSARSTVVRNLEKYGIAIREEDHQARTGNTAFGQRWVNKKLILNNKEMEVVEKARALRSQGHSYQKIADILNAMKIPTKSRKSIWYAKTVRGILLRSE